MAHAIIDEIGQILPPSRNLAETLARAADYATQQAHPEVTLEHLLLALTEDPDAVRVLTVSAVEIDQLKGDVSSHLGRLEERSANDGAAGISDDLRQILEASAAAARGRRDAIDGAIVLAAIVGDGRSTAPAARSRHDLRGGDQGSASGDGSGRRGVGDVRRSLRRGIRTGISFRAAADGRHRTGSSTGGAD